jgi:hypothetical protein
MTLRPTRYANVIYKYALKPKANKGSARTMTKENQAKGQRVREIMLRKVWTEKGRLEIRSIS